MIKKEFLYQYKHYNLYRVIDAVGVYYYIAEKDDPTQGPTMSEISDLNNLLKKIDDFYRKVKFKYLFGENHRDHSR